MLYGNYHVGILFSPEPYLNNKVNLCANVACGTAFNLALGTTSELNLFMQSCLYGVVPTREDVMVSLNKLTNVIIEERKTSVIGVTISTSNYIVHQSVLIS